MFIDVNESSIAFILVNNEIRYNASLLHKAYFSGKIKFVERPFE